MFDDVKNRIKSPGIEFRGAPFWSWNALLEKDELARQCAIFKEMGFGGFFMHPRIGLATEYLSREWFDCIGTCVSEAEKLGLYAYLYDEDRWPSGSAGGLVTQNYDFRERIVEMQFQNDDSTFGALPERSEVLGFFELVFEDKKLISYRKIKWCENFVKTNPSCTIARFVSRETDTDSWYNHQTYLDTMNPAAVSEFIKVTHEAYKREFGDKFGRTIPAVFSDEPCYLHVWGANCLQWTKLLSERFMEDHGYDVCDFLPELFYPCTADGFSKARLDFFNTCTRLFTLSYSRQIGSWCTKNSIAFTGHALGEDELSLQTHFGGSAMRFYEYMQMPGIDLLTEHWNIFETAKQCVSMAHQFDRKWRLSETYGCTGWDFPMYGHKALGDWQYALGINFRCHHLSFYSMAGEAKRDYPASIFYQSPWYRIYHLMEDYFARLGAALSEGEERRDLLMIHPIESMWGIKNNFDSTQEKICNAKFSALSRKILAANIDFDYGDEDVMARYTTIENGKLRINKASYKVVIIPEMTTIRSGTLSHLDEFADAGGTVFYLGEAPRYVDGISCIKNIYEKYIRLDEKSLIPEIERFARVVSVKYDGKETEETLSILRESPSHKTLFICNTGVSLTDESTLWNAPRVVDRRKTFDAVTVTMPYMTDAKVYELDLSNGEFTRVSVYETTDGEIAFETAFDFVQSRLFIMTDEDMKVADKHNESDYENLTIKNESFDYEIDDHNILVLDHAKWMLEGLELSEKEEYILDIDTAVRGKIPFAPRARRMVQAWYQKKFERDDNHITVKLVFKFECAKIPRGDCFIALEEAEKFKISFNGADVSEKIYGFWCDKAIKKRMLAGCDFRKGDNIIEMSFDYTQDSSGLEAIFILGEFGVYNDVIDKMPEKLVSGDIGIQGFPYYSGNITYFADVESNGTKPRQRIELCESGAFAMSVAVADGKENEEHLAAWAPFTVDLSGEIRAGINRLAIRLYGSRRNAFGPFYCGESHPAFCGSGHFCSYEYPEKKCTVSFGLNLTDK